MRTRVSSPSGKSALPCGPAAETRLAGFVAVNSEFFDDSVTDWGQPGALPGIPHRQGPPRRGRVGVERRLRPDACGGAAVLRGGGRGRLDSPRLGTAAHLPFGGQPADSEARGPSRYASVRTASERHAPDRCRTARAAPRARHAARLRPVARRHRQPARHRQRRRDHRHPGQPDRAIPARDGGPVHRRPSGGAGPGRRPRPRRGNALRCPRQRGPGPDLLPGPGGAASPCSGTFRVRCAQS